MNSWLDFGLWRSRDKQASRTMSWAMANSALSRRKQGFESPRERQWDQRLIRKPSVGVQQLSNKRLRIGMDVDDRKSCSCALRQRLAVCEQISDARPRAEIPNAPIFGVFLGRKASFLVTRGGCESFRKGKSQLPQNIVQRGRLMGPTAGPRIPA